MSEQIVINPSAKFQFMKDSKRISAHRNIMQMDQTQDSINMALLEYQRLLLVNAADANAAAAAGLKLKGALEFVDIMMKLGEAPRQSEKPALIQLDHRA